MPNPMRSVLATAKPRSAGGWLVALIAVLLLVAGAIGLVGHYRAPGRTWVLAISAFSPYLMLGAPLALIVLLVLRLWLPAVVALVVTALCVVTQVPLYTSTAPPKDATTLTIMTSNLRLGMANAADVVAAARRHKVDVLMLEELTPQEQAHLTSAGLDKQFPHHVSDPSFGGVGTGLWSRFPLGNEVMRHDFNFNFVSATATVPGVAKPVQFAAAHMCGPYPESACWLQDITHLPSVLPSLAARGTAIVGGDFNATPDVGQFRALLTDGWADGADQAGAGYTRTYPSDRAFPPLIAIDHVLTHEAVATSAQTVEIAGSDHRALVVQVAVPRSS